MADPVLDRYKEALKAGHVAVLRGHDDEAMARYREAAAVAPDRPLPLSSLGGVLARLGRFEDARSAYARALALGSRDESAVRGLAEALLAVGRGSDAATALDRLAELQAATARLPEALETLRRADALGAARRRAKRMAEIQAAIDGAPLRVATLTRTPRRIGPARAQPPAGPARPPRPRPPTVIPWTPAPPVAVRIADRASAPGAPPPEPLPDGEPLLREAEVAADEGRTDEAQAAFAAASMAYLAAGKEAAAIDACHRGLRLGLLAPSLHLQLAHAYLALGWRPRAVAKLVLLDRLLEIDGERIWRVALADLATARLADEPELADIVAAGANRRANLA
jgi:tetratricopeptide (TPR) repeat protein